MAYTPTVFVDGDTMDSADLLNTLQDAVDFVNNQAGQSIADWTLGTIDYMRLAHGSIMPWPNGTFESSFHAVGYHTQPYFERPSTSAASLAPLTLRDSIFPPVLGDEERWRLPRLSRTIEATGFAHLFVYAQLDYRVRHNDATAPPPAYPTILGGGDEAGRFLLRVRNRATGVWTEYDDSVVPIYPGGTAQSAPMMTSVELDPGTYDVQVVYVRGNTDDLVLQVDVTRQSMYVEVHYFSGAVPTGIFSDDFSEDFD